jgi:hypothetical protein
MKKLLIDLMFLPAVLSAQYETHIVDALVNPKRPEQVITVGGEKADIYGFST